jgi:tricorn protease
MKKSAACFLTILAGFMSLILAPGLFAQVDARMLQYPDVSASQIVFSYAGDLWLVPREGGTATKLSSPKGQELFPRFSPDGSQIAFNASYDGSLDIYVVPAKGGMPARVTNHGMPDRLLEWTPDGNRILFASSMASGKQRFSQFYAVPAAGGLPEKLPVPYGEVACFSPDGKKIVYTPQTQAFRTWKRYRGGWAPDLWMFDLGTLASERLSPSDAGDEFPMWHGGLIYFLSDRGQENRANIWAYDIAAKTPRQVTRFADYDIHFPSIGPSDIVFEAGGKIYLLGLSDEKTREVPVQVVTDEITLRPRMVNASGLIQWASAPSGKRALVQARGDIFSVPAENGPVVNLTMTPGTAELYPAISPDGKSAAYWSDKTGEYELRLADLKTPGAGQVLTSYGPGYRYQIGWSPDGKKIAFVDQKMEIHIFDVATKVTTQVDKCGTLFQGGLQDFRVGWSPDSRWIAYEKDLKGRGRAIFLYDIAGARLHQVTSGFYGDANPVFDPEGKYLYFLTNRTFAPLYSGQDGTWIYANSTTIASVPLSEDTPSPLAAKNDEAEAKKDEPAESKAPAKKGQDKEKDKAGSAGEEKAPPKDVKIALAGFENRVVILPPASGNFGGLAAASGKILFHRFPNTGSADKARPLFFYDLEKREEKKIIDDTDFFALSADGMKILVGKAGTFAIIDVAEGQKMDKKMPTGNLEMMVDPRAEWRQIFNDVWRFERDFFYDPNMHGVDWAAMRERYGKLLEAAVTRWDVNYVIGELIGELNASHTYRGGGDTEEAAPARIGYLGVDWEVADGAYRIKRIIDGAPWDSEVRSPLLEPGLKVKAGDYVLAVNGRPLTISQAPWGVFTSLAEQTVELIINDKPAPEGARTVLVKTLAGEERLRNLDWIESHRRKVEEASKGRIGYIYVPSTGIDGQNELYRQYMAQFDKDGLIIDERFNDGGQIPDRFIELLNRKPLAFWAVRDGINWPWPPTGHFGPKAMLINGWSGSGGDAFPDYFRKAGLGPLIGMRTWGGLIGISGAPGLIDGGGVTVPTFRMYDPDGKWFREGHGVDPDIEVVDDPTELARGTDPQLERAIQEVLKMLEKTPPVRTPSPAYEKR